MALFCCGIACIATGIILTFLFFCFHLQLNIFSTLPESSYDRPNVQSERALYSLVQEHLQDYEREGDMGEEGESKSEHATSTRFKELEKNILLNWSAKVRSSIFGEEKDEL